MNPAFSVILFTTLSGAGYGLLAWTGLLIVASYLDGRPPQYGVLPAIWAIHLLVGLLLAVFGLASSMFHLGKPARAWRAFSQWRSSWLSREGVLAMLAMVPVAGLLSMIATAYFERSYAILAGWIVPALAVTMMLLSLGTVVCTAMIYASLKTVPAWRHRLTVPVYLWFAIATGGGLYTSMWIFAGPKLGVSIFAAVASYTLVLAALKWKYWRDIDRIELPSREAATALEGFGTVTTFERPHTEANYLTREMGFVLARKHSRKLRTIAVLLFTGVPLPALAIAWLAQGAAPYALWVAALSALLGTFVERWLFFAEAKHVVTLYY